MALKLLIEAGGEYLLPFAKKKLRELKDEMKRIGQSLRNKMFMVSSGEQIFIQSQSVGFGQSLDAIRIHAGKFFMAITAGSYVPDGSPLRNLFSLLHTARAGSNIGKHPIFTYGYGQTPVVDFSGTVVLYWGTYYGGSLDHIFSALVTPDGTLIIEHDATPPAAVWSGYVYNAFDMQLEHIFLNIKYAWVVRTINTVLGITEDYDLTPAAHHAVSIDSIYAADRTPDTAVFGTLFLTGDATATWANDGVAYYKRSAGSAWVRHQLVEESSYGDSYYGSYMTYLTRRSIALSNISGDGDVVYTSTFLHSSDFPPSAIANSVTLEVYRNDVLYGSAPTTCPPVYQGVSAMVTYQDFEGQVNLTGSAMMNSVTTQQYAVSPYRLIMWSAVWVADDRGIFILAENVHDYVAPSYTQFPRVAHVGCTDDGQLAVYLEVNDFYDKRFVFCKRTTAGYEEVADYTETGNALQTKINPLNGKVGYLANDEFDVPYMFTLSLHGSEEAGYTVRKNKMRPTHNTFVLEDPDFPGTNRSFVGSMPYGANYARGLI